MSYYKIIGGVRYDRNLLEAAEAFTQGRGEFRISLEEIQNLYGQAGDGQVLTGIERDTLLYISKTFTLTEKARIWLSEQISAPSDDVEGVLQRVLKQEFGLPDIRTSIPNETVQQYLDAGSARNWETILRGAMDAFLKGSQGQLSFAACVARRDRMYDDLPDPSGLLKSYLDRGTLFLIPPDATAASDLPYDLPHVLDAANFWTFVVQTPDFEPVEFFAFVHQSMPFQYSKGQFSKKADLEHTIRAAVQQFAGFNQMKWNIPLAELTKQLDIIPGQNFGNALFAALNTGIFNQESSFSFGGFIREEIWLDPETPISEPMREYADTGTLHLIPLDYRAQTEADTAAFPIPERYAFWMDGEWVFGLEMPEKTDVKLILTTPRDGNDGDTGWNDGFIEDQLPMEEQLRKVLVEEFQLEGLELRMNAAEFELQRQQYGPDWRHLPGLLRQSLNTLFYDYLTVNSMFNTVAKRNQEEVEPTYFEDPKEYQAAIRLLIADYLRKDAVLELLPFTIQDENSFPFGETVADHWLVRAVAETLADHWFWVVIPRWPNEDQRPYNYID